MQGPHGEIFRYLSPNSDFLDWLVERVSGQSFAGLFSRLVWKPMGAEAFAYITVDGEGSPRTAGGICVLPRDLARFGEMMRLGARVFYWTGGWKTSVAAVIPPPGEKLI